MYSDSQTLDNSNTAIATVSETSLGKINIPSGRTYQVTGIWCGMANGGGGTYRLSIDTYPQANFKYVVNSDSNKATLNHPLDNTNVLIRGPAELEVLSTALSATSGKQMFNIQYIDNASPTN